MQPLVVIRFIIQIVFGLAEGIIGLRVLLKLLAANPAAPFVSWVYDTSQSLLTPFEGMFPSARLEQGIIVEFSALFALVMYATIAYLLLEALTYIDFAARRRGRPTNGTTRTL